MDPFLVEFVFGTVWLRFTCLWCRDTNDRNCTTRSSLKGIVLKQAGPSRAPLPLANEGEETRSTYSQIISLHFTDGLTHLPNHGGAS